MTLSEAIVSGKAMRRKGWTHADWLYVVGNKNSYGHGELHYRTGETRAELFYVDDLIALDWEVDGTPSSITKESE